MAAHPDTIAVVKTIHDTVYVVARDTIVRVAEPFHEHATTSFFGQMSLFEIIVASVDLVAGLLGLVVAIIAIRAYRDARAKIRHHLRTHIAIARNWVQGPSHAGPPTGWSPEKVTP